MATFGDVFRAEIEDIGLRRVAVGLPAPPASSPPSPDLGLVGLALSGGGIRSASFGLGVLQALAGAGVLPRVDYLSTVSGGGLIGATVTSTLQSPASSPDNDTFPLGFEPGVRERPAVRYLRQHDRYLAPGGFLDMIRLPAIVLRGVLDNAALLLPALMVLVTLTEVAYGLMYQWGEARLRWVPLGVAALFALAVLVQPMVRRLSPYRVSWAGRNRYEALLAILLTALIAALLLIPMFLLEQRAIDTSWDAFTEWVRGHGASLLAAGAGMIVASGVAAVLAMRPGLAGRVALVAIGLGAHAVVFGVFLLLTLYQVTSPVLDSSLRGDLESGQVTAKLVEVFAQRDVVLRVGDAIEPRRGGAGGWVIRSQRPQVVVASREGTLRVTSLLLLWDSAGEWYYLALGGAALLYGIFFFNPNVTSPHQFFRDRMSRAFVFAVTPDAQVEQTDALKLSDLRGAAAPYHLFNTTLNLQGAPPTLELGGRDADFFILARRYCGSVTTGYCRTEEIERHDTNMTVATAMAISGAGLAPNGGTQTVKPLVYLTTLLNLRLDYWLPNPAWVSGTSVGRRLRLGASVGPVYLLKEAFGLLDARGPYVNLSDGGHIENLGVYELLRRRCKVIVAVDASEDPGLNLGCLMDLIRYARIDLGIDIVIDVGALARGADGWSGAHTAVGEIVYGHEERGRLLYVKSSMTGDEPAPILEYHALHPAFPQESSNNQFFTESQFEAYRALGEHVAAEVHTSVGAPPSVSTLVMRSGLASMPGVAFT